MQTYDEVGSRREVLAVPDLVEALVQEPLVSYPVVPDPPVEVDDLKLVALGGAVLSQPRVYLLHQGVTLNFRICIWIYTQKTNMLRLQNLLHFEIYIRTVAEMEGIYGTCSFFILFYFILFYLFIYFFFFFLGGYFAQMLLKLCANIAQICPNIPQILPALDTLAKWGGGAQGPPSPISYAYGN